LLIFCDETCSKSIKRNGKEDENGRLVRILCITCVTLYYRLIFVREKIGTREDVCWFYFTLENAITRCNCQNFNTSKNRKCTIFCIRFRFYLAKLRGTRKRHLSTHYNLFYDYALNFNCLISDFSKCSDVFYFHLQKSIAIHRNRFFFH